jgi:DNA-binding transcriptional regulator YiaG
LSTQVRSLTKQLAKLEALVQSQQPEKEPRAPRSSAGFVFDHEALIAKRHELGLTQAQMAQLLGVSNLTAYKWETGAVHPRDSKLGRLQEVLKMGPRQAQKALSAAQE